MPSMKNEPCAKLTMRVTPKISDRPAATRNSDEAPARPLRSWTMKAERVMGVLAQAQDSSAPSTGSIDRAQLLDLGRARHVPGAVEVAVVDHHALATLVLGAPDEGAHRRLLVFAAVGDLAERRLHLQTAKRRDQLLGVGGLGLRHARGERLDRAVADHRAEPRIVAVFLLVGDE